MAKSIKVTTKKRRGRPATTGRGSQVGERWHEPELAAIDKWIAGSGETLTRGQAIRRLVEIGLKVSPRSARPAAEGNRARAAELATRAIDKHLDDDLHHDEKAVRKRRILKGPSMVRDVRKDQSR